MKDLSELFGAFENFERVIERVNPIYVPAVIFPAGYGGDERNNFFTNEITRRYVLVKLLERRIARHNILGGKNPFSKKTKSPIESPPKTAVPGKHWEQASYIVRFSSSFTHLGIAGSIMEELDKNVLGCKMCLRQSGHGEPAIIACNEKFGEYASVVGAGFAKAFPKEKRFVLYGRSRAFTVKYDSQIKYYLGMTGHEFVAKILQSELPEGWSVDVVNNDVEASIADGREIMPSLE